MHVLRIFAKRSSEDMRAASEIERRSRSKGLSPQRCGERDRHVFQKSSGAAAESTHARRCARDFDTGGGEGQMQR